MSFTSFWAIVAIFAASSVVRLLGRPRPALMRFAILGSLLAHLFTWEELSVLRSWFNAQYMDWVAANASRDPDVVNATIFPLSASLPLLLGFTGVVVFPAYFLVSLLLPTTCNAIQAARGHVGRAYGLNTLAFCAGAVLFLWVVPHVSLFYA